MRKFVLSALLSITSTLLFAQSDTGTTSTSTAALDTSAMAKIYVIRSTGHTASAVNLRILVDERMYCKVRNNRYATFWVEPGSHLFNATTWDKPGTPEKFALKLPVEAGKTYYMSLRLKQRLMTVEIYLEEITFNTAAPLLQKYKQDECD